MANKKKNNPSKQNAKNTSSQISIVKHPVIAAETLKDSGAFSKQDQEANDTTIERIFAAAIDTSNAEDVMEQLDMLLKGINKTIKATDPDFRYGMKEVYNHLIDGFLNARDEQELASISLCIILGRLYSDSCYWEIECAEDEHARYMSIIAMFDIALDLLNDPDYDDDSLVFGCPSDTRRWIRNGLDLCNELADYAEFLVSSDEPEHFDFEADPDDE